MVERRLKSGLHEVREPLGSRDVRQLRQQTGLSQEKLARLLGTSWVTVSRWERNQGAPSGETEDRLVRLLTLVSRIGNALPLDRLYDFLDTPHPSFRDYRPVELLKSDYSFVDLINFVESAKSGDMA